MPFYRVFSKLAAVGMVVLLLDARGSAADTDIAVQEYLDGMKELDGKTLVADFVTRVSGNSRFAGCVTESGSVKVRHVGERWHMVRTTSSLDLTRRSAGPKERYECLGSPEECLMVWSDPSTGLATGSVMVKRGKIDEVWANRFVSEDPGFLLGMLDPGGGRWAPAMLSGASASLDRLTPGGTELVRVHSEGSWGRLHLWLDPQAGSLPRRCEITKDRHHNRGSVQSAEGTWKPMRLEDWAIANNPFFPKSNYRQLVNMIEVENINSEGAQPAITGYRRLVKHVLESGDVVLFTTDVGISGRFDDEKGPWVAEAKIPDGTRVQIIDDTSGVEYEWRSGKIVKRYEHTVLGRMTGTLTRGNWLTRGLAALAGVAALGAVGYVLLRSLRGQAGR